jgi:hypothetical protein
MSSHPAEALELVRPYLEVLARVHLDARLRGKLDPANVVQQAFAGWKRCATGCCR